MTFLKKALKFPQNLAFFDKIFERNGELELERPWLELELERNGISKWNWNCERNGKNSGTVHALNKIWIGKIWCGIF